MLGKVLPSYLESGIVAEVLVVDDGSADETRATVTGWGERDRRVKLIAYDRNIGRTFARNTGIESASGDYVFFSEDDLAIQKGSLEILHAHIEQHHADVMGGRRIWVRLGESVSDAEARANLWKWPVVNKRLMEHYSHAQTDNDVDAPLVSASMLVRKEVLEQVRFADCYRGNAWREESDFQLQALELGYRVMFCPHAQFFHYDRLTAGRGSSRLVSNLRYLYWIYRNNVAFLRRHREYLSHNIPESLILGSPVVTSAIYLLYRGTLLSQTEARRSWASRKLNWSADHEHASTERAD